MATKKTQPARGDGRRPDALRPVAIQTDFIDSADGSCLISLGRTRVICTASVLAGVPDWLAGKGRGWVTAEYGMLPASTSTRKSRPIAKPDGRATEIQRLIGRVLRSAIDFERLGEHTVCLDCDVIVADGGTRTASITGACVALARALAARRRQGLLPAGVLRHTVAALSAGVVAGRCVLDMDYAEDSRSETDLNAAVTARGELVEVQGSAERAPFTAAQLQEMLALVAAGCRRLTRLQKQAIAAEAPGEHRLG